MSEELRKYCEEFEFKDGVKTFLNNLESFYNSMAEGEAETYGGSEGQLTMCEWIFENTSIDELSELSDRERFLYGFGVLTSEMGNYSS